LVVFFLHWNPFLSSGFTAASLPSHWLLINLLSKPCNLLNWKLLNIGKICYNPFNVSEVLWKTLFLGFLGFFVVLSWVLHLWRVATLLRSSMKCGQVVKCLSYMYMYIVHVNARRSHLQSPGSAAPKQARHPDWLPLNDQVTYTWSLCVAIRGGSRGANPAMTPIYFGYGLFP